MQRSKSSSAYSCEPWAAALISKFTMQCKKRMFSATQIMTSDQAVKLLLFPSTLLATIISQNYVGIDVGLPCVFKMLFDIDCIGCGISRAVMEIWQGNFSESFGYHKLGIVVFIAIGMMSIAEIFTITNAFQKRGKVYG